MMKLNKYYRYFLMLTFLMPASCSYLFPELTSEKIDVKEAYAFLKNHKGDEDVILIDLRNKEEFDKGHIENAVNMDYSQTTFPDAVESLDREKRYILIDRTQNKSMNTAELMKEMRFDKVHLVIGGWDEWNKQGVPVTF